MNSTYMTLACAVVRRPHFRLVGNELFFLISRRPHAKLSDAEARVWNALHGAVPFDRLCEQLGDEAEAAVSRLVDLEVCEKIEAHFPAGRRRILVIEPHSDDAILSVGGTMWLRRSECEFTIATIASKSNFTTYCIIGRDYFDVEKVSTVRGEEGSLVARMLGGHYMALDQVESMLRYNVGNWTLDWYRQHQLAAHTGICRSYSDELLAKWASVFAELLKTTNAEEIWLPLAVGLHCDHQLTRDAFLAAIMREPGLVDGKIVKFYEEVPYALRNPPYASALVNAMNQAGARLNKEAIAVDSAFAQKLRMISIYASQFKLEAMREQIESNARLGGSGKMSETLWRMDRIPSTFDLASLSIDQPLMQRLFPYLRKWISKHRSAKRIRLLLLLPSGRWSDDAKILLETFSETIFDVYVATGGFAELATVLDSRFRIRQVGRGIKSWTLLSLRLAFAVPAPTIFVAGDKRLKIGARLAKLWPLSDTLTLASMDHLMKAIHKIKQ